MHRAQIVFAKLFLVNHLLRGTTSQVFLLCVLSFSVEFSNEVKVRPPKVDVPQTTTGASKANLQLRKGQSRKGHIDSADGFSRTVRPGIRELHCPTGPRATEGNGQKCNLVKELVTGEKRSRQAIEWKVGSSKCGISDRNTQCEVRAASNIDNGARERGHFDSVDDLGRDWAAIRMV